MARLVIVSNRVIGPGDRSRAGGLAVGVREALRADGGAWFGWSGNITDTSSEHPRVVAAGKVTYLTVDLSQADHDRYYVGYANSTLWPLLHFRLGLLEYKRREFEGYRDVNALLARALLPFLQPDDVLWVHDYHLIPFGAELRRHGVVNRIGFFLHTPFPPADVLVALPHYDALIESLCAYDLVGFQTQDGVRAFLDVVVSIGNGRLLDDGAFMAFGRHSRAAAFPIGIDCESFVELARQAATSSDAQRLRASQASRSLIIGVDRLDYSKGIPNRFDAIDALLTDWPEHRRQFNYLQITPLSRDTVAQYRALRRQLDSAVGRINSRFAEFDWSPIRYVNRSFSRGTLAGFYRLARVGLVTPLRDGMNLVAKEFVAAQDPEDPGVLILSRFAGAARELDAALLVNPYDIDEMAAALHRALVMAPAERRERWLPLMAAVRENTISTWRETFVAALQAAGGRRAVDGPSLGPRKSGAAAE